MKHFVVIAGNIAAGKTTLTQLLSQQLEWEPFLESVAENPYLADFYQDVCTQFRAALECEGIRAALARPGEQVELWQEQGFDTVLEGRWVTGKFDRVVIFRDESGTAVRAVISDFKSDQIEPGDKGRLNGAIKRYKPQLELYAQALAKILSLDEEKIVRQLIFTRALKVVEV